MAIYCYAQFGCWVGKRCEQTQDNNKHWETDFVTSSQNGEPQALYRPDGTLHWQAPKSTLWGQRQGSTEDPADPGLAFAGQYRDTESGLCYNRFRYYDPAGGCYVSPDPIGIAGGHNNYAYAPNPISWIDPLGLRGKCSTGYKNADDAGRAALTKYNHMSIFKNREYGGIIFKAQDGTYGYTRGRLGSGRTAPTFKESSAGLPKGSTPVGQYHTHGDYSILTLIGIIVLEICIVVISFLELISEYIMLLIRLSQAIQMY